MVEVMNKEVEKVEDFKTEHINRDYVPFDYFSEPSEITEEEMIKQEQYFKKKAKIVKYVLEGYELARNYDTVMELECLRTEFPMIEVTDGKKYIFYKFPKKWIRIIMRTPLEDYRRCRQLLVRQLIKANDKESLKQILPTDPQILEKRMRKEKILREYFRRKLK